DAARNVLIASQDPAHPRLMSAVLRTAAFNWLADPPAAGTRLLARIRHRQALQACTIERHGDDVEVRFDVPQRAVVAGQYCVLYDGQRCLGGGEIARTA
ncbi:MAG: aminomethyltransferase beta-barrel domain-containing protein, partial [Pseudomonadota bacterium]